MRIEQLNNLPIWMKISEGDIHLVSRKDVQQLFNVMDDGKKGYVSGADIMTLQAVDAANLTENDLQAMLVPESFSHQELVKDVDKDGNSKCSAARHGFYHILHIAEENRAVSRIEGVCRLILGHIRQRSCIKR